MNATRFAASALEYCRHPARREFPACIRLATELEQVVTTGEGLDAVIDACRGECAGVDPQSFCFRRPAGEPAWEAFTIVQAFDGEYLLR